MANLHYPLSWWNQVILYYHPQTQHHSFFRNLPTFLTWVLKSIFVYCEDVQSPAFFNLITSFERRIWSKRWKWIWCQDRNKIDFKVCFILSRVVPFNSAKKFQGRLYERGLRISHTPWLYNDGSQEYYNSHFIDLEISTVSKTFARYLTNLTTSWIIPS